MKVKRVGCRVGEVVSGFRSVSGPCGALQGPWSPLGRWAMGFEARRAVAPALAPHGGPRRPWRSPGPTRPDGLRGHGGCAPYATRSAVGKGGKRKTDAKAAALAAKAKAAKAARAVAKAAGGPSKKALAMARARAAHEAALAARQRRARRVLEAVRRGPVTQARLARGLLSRGQIRTARVRLKARRGAVQARAAGAVHLGVPLPPRPGSTALPGAGARDAARGPRPGPQGRRGPAPRGGPGAEASGPFGAPRRAPGVGKAPVIRLKHLKFKSHWELFPTVKATQATAAALGAPADPRAGGLTPTGLESLLSPAEKAEWVAAQVRATGRPHPALAPHPARVGPGGALALAPARAGNAAPGAEALPSPRALGLPWTGLPKVPRDPAEAEASGWITEDHLVDPELLRLWTEGQGSDPYGLYTVLQDRRRALLARAAPSLAGVGRATRQKEALRQQAARAKALAAQMAKLKAGEEVALKEVGGALPEAALSARERARAARVQRLREWHRVALAEKVRQDILAAGGTAPSEGDLMASLVADQTAADAAAAQAAAMDPTRVKGKKAKAAAKALAKASAAAATGATAVPQGAQGDGAGTPDTPADGAVPVEAPVGGPFGAPKGGAEGASEEGAEGAPEGGPSGAVTVPGAAAEAPTPTEAAARDAEDPLVAAVKKVRSARADDVFLTVEGAARVAQTLVKGKATDVGLWDPMYKALTWSHWMAPRWTPIVPAMVGVTLWVHNGRTWVPVVPTDLAVGRKVGEYVPTRWLPWPYEGRERTVKGGKAVRKGQTDAKAPKMPAKKGKQPAPKPARRPVPVILNPDAFRVSQ